METDIGSSVQSFPMSYLEETLFTLLRNFAMSGGIRIQHSWKWESRWTLLPNHASQFALPEKPVLLCTTRQQALCTNLPQDAHVSKQTGKHTHAQVQRSHASVGLAQAHPMTPPPLECYFVFGSGIDSLNLMKIRYFQWTFGSLSWNLHFLSLRSKGFQQQLGNTPQGCFVLLLHQSWCLHMLTGIHMG